MKATSYRLNLAGIAWVITMVVIGGATAFMLLDNQLPTEYVGGSAIIVPNPAEDGGRVIVKMLVKRNRECPGIVSRSLVDEDSGETIAIYDPVPVSMSPVVSRGVAQEIGKTFELPEGLPPRVRYKARVCFRCNFLQEFRPLCTNAPDVVFSVKPRGT